MNHYRTDNFRIDGFECSIHTVVTTTPSIILHENGDEFDLELNRRYRSEVVDGKLHITFSDLGDGSEVEYVADEDPEQIRKVIEELYKKGKTYGVEMKKTLDNWYAENNNCRWKDRYDIIYEKLVSLLVKKFGADEDKLLPGTVFYDELGLDSLDSVLLLSKIPDTFGIDKKEAEEILPPESWKSMSVHELVLGIMKYAK